MNDFISPFQTSFIPGRRAADNVFILRELMQFLKKRKGKKSFFILKVDLEKAYDRMEWSFVRTVLMFFRFPEELVRLILKCTSSTKVNVLLNGGKLEHFFPSRGLRQGDPLSPYLFILCLEYLSCMVEKELSDQN